MTRRGLALLVVILTMAVVLACQLPQIGTVQFPATVRGSGTMAEEMRSVTGITGVMLGTVGTLHVEVGNEESLRIEAEDNIIPLIETEVRNGTLNIEMRPNTSVFTTRSIDYYLTVVELTEVSTASSGDIIVVTDVAADRFAAHTSSSGDISIGDLTCDTLDARLSSSGDITIDQLSASAIEAHLSSSGNLNVDDGEVERQNVSLSSSGDYNARNLASQEATLRLSSSGSATVWVGQTLDARLSSSGDVLYRGNPSVDYSSSSSGDLRPLGD